MVHGQAVESIDQVLDRLHAAAAHADERAYFELFAPDAVFLGTDATERWSVDEFKAYAHPIFAAGKGWAYTSTERHIGLGPDGRTAWFDERLQNAKLGECRGSGALVNRAGRWAIVQYNLSIPVPNDLAEDLVQRIRASTNDRPAGK